MTLLIHPYLLCGGSGTRLWPLSRESYPKQFVKFKSDESLFQASARLVQGAGFAAPGVITGSDFRFTTAEQLAAVEIAPADILIEPAARNTAAAICAAALSLEAKSTGALMLVLPSDHVIPDTEGFRRAVAAAAPTASGGQLVTFGIRPSRPETGYGWLELSEKTDTASLTRPQPLKSFVEKPDLATAERLLAGGMHLWNAGIFLFSTSAILEAFARHAPETLSKVKQALSGAEHQGVFTYLAADLWADLENISLDYAVMERADNLSVMPFGGAWSDLGDWQAVWRENSPDHDGNVTLGTATAIDCNDTLLQATSEAQQLVGIGLDGLVAVAMPDAVLVVHKDRTQDVKLAINALNAKSAPQARKVPREHHPWGWQELVDKGAQFQVRRMVIRPDCALPVQSQNLAEHWIVVEGSAKVMLNGAVKLMREGESVYLPSGASRKLENTGEVPATLIAVQFGH